MINSTYKKPFFTSAPSSEAYLGDLKADGTVPLTADWVAGNFKITAGSFALTGTGTLTSTLGNASFTTALTAASGNEVGFLLSSTINKAAGNYTAFKINATETSAPGTTNYLIDLQVGTTSKFAVDNAGKVRLSGNIQRNSIGGDLDGFSSWTPRDDNASVNFGYGTAKTLTFSHYGGAAGARTNTSGSAPFVQLSPIYNQASGTAANTDLLINRTETAIGSGTQRFISAGTGGGTYVEKFAVDNTGLVYSTPIAITAGSGTGLTVNSTGNVNRQVYKVTVTYAGFSAAATTADKTIATLPAKTKIVGFYADTTAAFTGGAVSATALTVGKSAGGVEYIATHDVLSAAIVRGLADADMGTELTRAAAIQGGAIVNWAATTTVSARITTTTANTNALTAGSVTFYIVTERY